MWFSVWALVVVAQPASSCDVFMIVSGQRSGSSNLALTIASLSSDRVLDWNEVFNFGPGQTSIGRWLNASASERRCEAPSATLTAALRNAKKGAVLKLFDMHCSKWHDRASLDDLLNLENACYIVLERNPADRECSLSRALNTSDWSITPEDHAHHSDYSDRPACPEQASPNFAKDHDEWFQMVRTTLHKHAKPFFDLRSETYINNFQPIEDVAREILALGGYGF